MNLKNILGLCCTLVASSSACVSAGTYDALVAKHEGTKKNLESSRIEAAANKKQGDELQAALKAEQERAAGLEASRKALAAEVEARQKDLEKTQGDLAQVVKDRSSLKGSVEQMRAALDELARRKAEADRRIAEYKSLLSRFQKLIDAGKLRVKIVDGRMVVALASDILFASGSASLSKEGKTAIEEVAAVLSTIPERRFQVEGHTDNVPIKTAQFPSNWELAAARALIVTKTMVEAGLPGERVSAASFGESKPAVSNDTPDGKAQNRRIEIVVVPDLSTLPGFDELQKASQ